jgi:hypothetical protein
MPFLAAALALLIGLLIVVGGRRFLVTHQPHGV